MSQNTDKNDQPELSDDQLEEAAGGCLIYDPKFPLPGPFPGPFPGPIVQPLPEPLPGPILPPDIDELH